MIDVDLAELYGVPTYRLNERVSIAVAGVIVGGVACPIQFGAILLTPSLVELPAHLRYH